MLGTTIQTLKIGGGAEKSSDAFYATENVCDGYVSYLFLTISLNFLLGHYDRLVYATKVI